MTRRAALPGAAELFRSTERVALDRVEPEIPAQPLAHQAQGTGRQRHDAKITVYVSAEELVELERVRLALRADHGLAVDRGRIVRESIAALLTDFELNGADSVLARRLQNPPPRAAAGPTES